MNRVIASILLASALIAAISCGRTQKPDAQAALDDAYKSGLLTKDEYDAKRDAIAAAAVAALPAKAVEVPVTTSEKPVAVNNILPQNTPAPEAAASTPAPKPPVAEPSVTLPKPNSAPATPTPVATPRPETAYEKEDRGIVEPPERTEAKEPPPAPLKGCEDEDFKSGGAKSDARFFAASPERVHQAAIGALEGLDFNIRKDNKNEIEATKKRGIGVVIGAGGERVILKFHKQERNGVNGTSVEGETHKSFVGRLAQRTWTDAVLAQMACKLRESRK